MNHGSEIISKTFIVGFKDAYGSWKTTWTFLLKLSKSFLLKSKIFLPLYNIVPVVGSIKLKIKFESVVLPDPDSPTIPIISFVYRLKLMSSHATVS